MLLSYRSDLRLILRNASNSWIMWQNWDNPNFWEHLKSLLQFHSLFFFLFLFLFRNRNKSPPNWCYISQQATNIPTEKRYWKVNTSLKFALECHPLVIFKSEARAFAKALWKIPWKLNAQHTLILKCSNSVRFTYWET